MADEAKVWAKENRTHVPSCTHSFQKQSLRKTKHKLKRENKIRIESSSLMAIESRQIHIRANKGGLMFIQELSQQCVHTCHSFRRKSSTIL